MSSDVIFRLLKSARGPRSVRELSKGTNLSERDVTNILETFKSEGKAVHIDGEMWCFNPKFAPKHGFSTGYQQQPRLPSSRYIPPPPPKSTPSSCRSSYPLPHSQAPPSCGSNQKMCLREQTHTAIQTKSSIPPLTQTDLPLTSQWIHSSRQGGSLLAPPPSAMTTASRDTSVTCDPCPSDPMTDLDSTSRRILSTMQATNSPWSLEQISKAIGMTVCDFHMDMLSNQVVKIPMSSPAMYAVKPGAKLPSPAPKYPSSGVQDGAGGRLGGAGGSKRARYSDPGPTLESTTSNQDQQQAPVKKLRLDKVARLTLDAINKNPVSAIVELGQALGSPATFNIIRTSGPKNRLKYHMRLSLGDRIFDSVSTNKKDAKVHVAELALRSIHSEAAADGSRGSEGLTSAPHPVPLPAVVATQRSRYQEFGCSSVPDITPVPAHSLPGINFFDKIGKFSYELYHRLSATVASSFPGRKVIAVFVLEDTRVTPVTWCPVAMGTGNRTITGENINFEGKTVNDAHAEIIARRGLRRFLCRQLQSPSSFPSGSTTSEGLLVGSEVSPGKKALHPQVKLHLFISTAPCGDSAIFPIADIPIGGAGGGDDPAAPHIPLMENDKQGLLRSKMESGQGTIPTNPNEDPLTVDGIIMGHQRVKTMSCSDKVSRWNVLGLQGCLLSEFLDPVYLSSLTLGCLFHPGHLSRAVCCRYRDLQPPFLPPPYRLNHPLLGCVPGQEQERELGKTTEMSLNWTLGDTHVEVLDGVRGRTGKGQESRLSRKVIFGEVRRVGGWEGKEYHAAKQSCDGYQEAKQAFLKTISDNRYGKWIVKPIY